MWLTVTNNNSICSFLFLFLVKNYIFTNANNLSDKKSTKRIQKK